MPSNLRLNQLKLLVQCFFLPKNGFKEELRRKEEQLENLEKSHANEVNELNKTIASNMVKIKLFTLSLSNFRVALSCGYTWDFQPFLTTPHS